MAGKEAGLQIDKSAWEIGTVIWSGGLNGGGGGGPLDSVTSLVVK